MGVLIMNGLQALCLAALVICASAATVNLNSASNDFHAFEASNTIHGFGGDDVLYGGDGDDSIYGDEGNDRLYGGLGDDELFGGSGDDLLDGGYGDDIITFEEGANTGMGGAGDDTFEVMAGGGVIHTGAGSNTININAVTTGLELNLDGSNTVNINGLPGGNIEIRSFDILDRIYFSECGQWGFREPNNFRVIDSLAGTVTFHGNINNFATFRLRCSCGSGDKCDFFDAPSATSASSTSSASTSASSTTGSTSSPSTTGSATSTGSSLTSGIDSDLPAGADRICRPSAMSSLDADARPQCNMPASNLAGEDFTEFIVLTAEIRATGRLVLRVAQADNTCNMNYDVGASNVDACAMLGSVLNFELFTYNAVLGLTDRRLTGTLTPTNFLGNSQFEYYEFDSASPDGEQIASDYGFTDADEFYRVVFADGSSSSTATFTAQGRPGSCSCGSGINRGEIRGIVKISNGSTCQLVYLTQSTTDIEIASAPFDECCGGCVA